MGSSLQRHYLPQGETTEKVDTRLRCRLSSLFFLWSLSYLEILASFTEHKAEHVVTLLSLPTLTGLKRLSRKFRWGLKKNHAKIVAKRNINIVTPRRSKYECAESDNATMLRRGGLPLFIGPCGV